MLNYKISFACIIIFTLLCCVGAVSAISNDTIDNSVFEMGSDDEFISVNVDDQVDNMEKSGFVLSAQEENSNLTVNNDDEVLSLDSNEDSYLGVSSSETNRYLEDIKSSTSDEYYKFVNYLIKEKGFKFKGKTSNDGYTVYSNTKYQSKLYDGSNYVLSAGTSYFLSKNRISFVLDEVYPDVLYVSGNNYVLDELYLGWLKWTEKYHPSLTTGGTSNIKTNNIKTVSSPKYLLNGNSKKLPESFDLRKVDNVTNFLTPVKNQFQGGNCWAFASITALESFLLKNENKSYEFSNKYDFSENNLKNVMSSLGKQGSDLLVNSGGSAGMAIAYFLRWGGPISDELDKYVVDKNEKCISNTPLEFDNSEKHVQGVKYIQRRSGPKDNDEIKHAILDYGCVVTSMTMIQKLPYLNIYKKSYYYDGDPIQSDSNNNSLMHEVCIVGWG